MIESILEFCTGVLEPRALWFAGLFALFTVLALWRPARIGQKILRDEFKTDILYWFSIPLLYLPVFIFLIAVGFTLMFGDDGDKISSVLRHGYAPLNQLPLWLQVILIRLIADLIDYGTHRFLHRSRYWKWHAIHHMPTEIDWLTSARTHPVNMLLELATSGIVTVLLGFDQAAFAILVPITILYAAMVHANLDWDFGKLGYVFASPKFHRWHHTSPELGGDKNYASVFAFIDVIFGTYYMPKNDSPDNHPFGVSEEIPRGKFIQQLLWPFKQR